MQPMQPAAPPQQGPPQGGPPDHSGGYRYGNEQFKQMSVGTLSQAHHNTLRGWNDVPSNVMSSKSKRQVPVAAPITAPVAMMTPMQPMQPGAPSAGGPGGAPATAAAPAPAPVQEAAPPPRPVFTLAPDAQAMADAFNAVVDICKQGSNHAQAHKLHTVDEGLNSLFGACAAGSLGPDKIMQLHQFASALQNGDHVSGLQQHRELTKAIGAEHPGAVVPLKSLVSLVKAKVTKGQWGR